MTTKQDKRKKKTSSTINLADPYDRLACAVLAQAGMEYKDSIKNLEQDTHIHNKEKAEVTKKIKQIRSWILDENNVWMRYMNLDGEDMMGKIDREVQRSLNPQGF